MTSCVRPLYCCMEVSGKYSKLLEPALNLSIAWVISLITAVIAFWSAELDQQTLVTFVAYFLILAIMTFMFRIRASIINPSTAQLLQFSYILLGFVLVVIGLLGMLARNIHLAIVFLLVLILPGLASIRAGLHFKNTGE